MKRRPLSKIIAAAAIGVVSAFFLLELTLRLLIGVGALNDSGRTWDFYVNTYTGDGFKCTFQEALEIHPYLGWLTGPYLPCGRFVRNNRGFWDRRDLPYERNPELYTVMIVGGSVASQVAHGSGDDARPFNWLEDELNSRYRSPNGRPFRVVSGAMGGWRMPTQVTAAAMFGSQVDAIISIDGYNEMTNVIIDKPVDRPDAWTWYAVQNPLSGVLTIELMKVMKYVRIVISNVPVLRDSKVLFGAFEGILSLLGDGNVTVIGETEQLRNQFSYPREWTTEKAEQANIVKWQNYILSLRATAESMGLRYAHFIQPIPDLDKTLSEDELKRARWITGERYLRSIVHPAEALKKQGVPVVSLTSVFRDIKETIYGDEVHCAYDERGDNRGYRIMSRFIATSLGDLWKLKPLAKTAESPE